MDNLETIGWRLCKMRKNSKQSAKALEDMIGLPRGAVYQIERGDRDLRTADIIRIATHFHVSADYLLGIPRSSELGAIAAGEEIGLTENAIIRLRNARKRTTLEDAVMIAVIEELLKSDNIWARIADFALEMEKL